MFWNTIYTTLNSIVWFILTVQLDIKVNVNVNINIILCYAREIRKEQKRGHITCHSKQRRSNGVLRYDLNKLARTLIVPNMRCSRQEAECLQCLELHSDDCAEGLEDGSCMH